MTEFWQKVLVSEIGVYVLLSLGLNVVIGWAGLLDLGYIAFFAVGAYTTAYLVGALPKQASELAAPLAAGDDPVRDRRLPDRRRRCSARRRCGCVATIWPSSRSASARSSSSSR